MCLIQLPFCEVIELYVYIYIYYKSKSDHSQSFIISAPNTWQCEFFGSSNRVSRCRSQGYITRVNQSWLNIIIDIKVNPIKCLCEILNDNIIILKVMARPRRRCLWLLWLRALDWGRSSRSWWWWNSILLGDSSVSTGTSHPHPGWSRHRLGLRNSTTLAATGLHWYIINNVDVSNIIIT